MKKRFLISLMAAVLLLPAGIIATAAVTAMVTVTEAAMAMATEMVTAKTYLSENSFT